MLLETRGTFEFYVSRTWGQHPKASREITRALARPNMEGVLIEKNQYGLGKDQRLHGLTHEDILNAVLNDSDRRLKDPWRENGNNIRSCASDLVFPGSVSESNPRRDTLILSPRRIPRKRENTERKKTGTYRTMARTNHHRRMSRGRHPCTPLGGREGKMGWSFGKL